MTQAGQGQMAAPRGGRDPSFAWRVPGGGPTRGLRFLYWAFRFLPLRLGYLLVIGLAPIYFLHFNRPRHAMVRAMRRVGLRRPWWAALKAYCAYVLLLVDRHYAREGRLDVTVQRGPGGAELDQMVGRPGPLVLLGSHCGALEIAARAVEAQGRPLRAVAFRDEGARRLLAGVGDPGVAVGDHETIAADRTVAAGLRILGALRRGEVIAFKADRVLPGSRRQDRLLVPLFGELAELPSGPAEIVRLARAQALVVHVFRVGPGRYEVVAERLDTSSGDADAIVRSWAQGMEREVLRHPEQWFNFYPFWPSDAAELAWLPEKIPPGTRVAFPAVVGALFSVAVSVVLLAMGGATMAGLRPLARGALLWAFAASLAGSIGFGLAGAAVDRMGRRNTAARFCAVVCPFLATAAALLPGGLSHAPGPVFASSFAGLAAGCAAALLPGWWTLRPDPPAPSQGPDGDTAAGPDGAPRRVD